MQRTKFVSALALVLVAAIMPAPARAQITFERTYGGEDDDFARAVVLSSSGGYFFSGFTYSTGSGGADIQIVATDEHGEIQWIQTFGGQYDDLGYGIALFRDGGVVAAGYLCGMNQVEVALHANAANGDQRWIKVYGGSRDDIACSVASNSDGGFIVAGATYSFGAGQADVYVLRIDSLGDTLWTRTCGGAQDDSAFSAQQTADSGFIICGTTCSFGAGLSDIYLIKTNAAGDTQWTRTYGGVQSEHGHSVVQTPDSGYIICGTTLSYGAGDADIWLVRTDTKGDTLWTRTLGRDSADLGHSVCLTSDGGFILCGQTASFGAGNYDAWLVRTDSAGDTLWTRTFGGPRDDRAYSVRQTADGGFIVAGMTRSFGTGGSDYWFIKTDPNGNLGVAEESPTRQPVGRKPGATVLRNLPSGAAAFDALGRRALNPKPGIYFVRTRATTSLQKVLLVR